VLGTATTVVEARPAGPPAPGRILLLIGTSSSGKTTLVRRLQASLPELWLEMGIDRFAHSLPGRAAGELVWPQLFRYVPIDDGSEGRFAIRTTPLGRRFISGLHATVAGMAGLGFNVIVDQVILERSWLQEAARVWAPFVVLFVGVRCPLEVVVKRELERKDRTLGQAQAQFDVVHEWAAYDVEVDTSRLDPDEAADRVRTALAAGLAMPGAALVR
jgi:chloramphenicol 3-O phosphotransferase